MPYLKRAADLDLTGYECKVCGWSALADTAIYFDGDQDADGKPVPAVWCTPCRQAIDQSRMVTWLQAANLARFAGHHGLADLYLTKSQQVAIGMEQPSV
jgi:hypothetical protein